MAPESNFRSPAKIISRAWSAVGGAGRLVRVKYPWRPIYGVNPLFALIGGLVATFIGLRAKRFFSDAARGDAWGSIYDRFEQQDWLIGAIATGTVFLSFIPILVGLWAALAGAADMFNAVERTGVIVRARRPAEVTPLPRALVKRVEGDRYSLFVAVDDGSSDTITAWRANERTATPAGRRRRCSRHPNPRVRSAFFPNWTRSPRLILRLFGGPTTSLLPAELRGLPRSLRAGCVLLDRLNHLNPS